MPSRRLCSRQVASTLPPLTQSAEAVTTVRYLRAIAVGVLCLLSFQSHAQSTKADATTSIGLQSVTIGERGTELLLRFDRPINHARSWISLTHDGRIIETIHFRLEAGPNVLFARIQTPAPGNYIARWRVCPEGSDDSYEGEFSFTVGHVAASVDPGTRPWHRSNGRSPSLQRLSGKTGSR
jgi:hypothetical protein